jgi:acetyl esterase
MRRYWDWYVPDMRKRSEPFANPLAASDTALKMLPPLYLLAAECDPLASDTLLFKERLDRVGRSDPLHVEPGVVHGFLQMTPKLAAARDCVAAAGRAARKMIDSDL